jgi:hypothetical protein
MVESDNLRYTRIALNNGSGAIPALGFGTLIPDPVATRTATKAALEAGFRQLDASERYRNEEEVGEAMQEVFKAGKIKREEVWLMSGNWWGGGLQPPSRGLILRGVRPNRLDPGGDHGLPDHRPDGRGRLLRQVGPVAAPRGAGLPALS